jgi:predicted ATPase
MNYMCGIQLDRFKCFPSQFVSLNRLTVLTGVNGMGKSTVIQSLLLLRQSARAGTLHPVDQSGTQAGLLLNGDFTHLGTGGDVLCESANEDSIGFSIRTASTSVSWQFNAPIAADLLPWIEGPPRIPELSIFGEHCYYLGAERTGPRDVYALSASQIERHDLGADGALAAAFLEARGEQQVLAEVAHVQSSGTGLWAQTNAWMGEISPTVRIATKAFRELSLAQLTFSFVAGRNSSSRQHRPSNVGFGLSYTLPVVVALLAAPKGSLVLVENPEAHLHPRGQMAMGDLIARAAAAGVQVILETHSDHVLNGIRLAVHESRISHELVIFHFFQRESLPEPGSDVLRVVSRIVSPKIDKNGRIDIRPDGFFDQWDKSLRKLLTPAKE